MRFAAALMLLTCLFAGLASASSSSHSPKKAEAEREKGSGFSGPRIPTISMPALVAPVVVNGELHHYVFLSVSLELTGDEHKSMMLEKVPYLQDAYLREVHRESFAKDNDPKVIDDEGLKGRLMRVTATVVGPNIVKALTLRDVVQGAQ